MTVRQAAGAQTSVVMLRLFFVARTLKIYSLRNFEIHNAVLLTNHC